MKKKNKSNNTIDYFKKYSITSLRITEIGPRFSIRPINLVYEI